MKERTRANAGERAQRVQRIVEDCLAQRLAGCSIADEAVLSAHPDLLPELAEELRALHIIQQAQRRAQDTLQVTSQNEISGSNAETRLRDDAGGDSAAAGLLTPAAIPGYEIKREIHRGGQGVVYEALQKTTGRTVAIKVMKEGPFAGPGDRARFEREVRILAQLKHPNIVAIHDSGTAAGCFYYVMDYIPGQSLSEWMKSEAARPICAALALFAGVCEAVNVAHLRGVIHRDLKPGNIRVDPSDQPHILDFGLAKLSEFDVLEDTPTAVMTQTGQFVGSLPWASPEQAEGRPEKIDVRTDVYALGVVFYQMLTDKFPYGVAGAFQDVLHNIRYAEPAKPSGLRHEIDDEVETIVLKCLSKEPERRYQSAGEVARDLRSYLAGEPIEAKRDSAGYVLRKQLRRHKLPIVIAAGFVLTVTAGLIASLFFWHQAAVERDKARLAERLQAQERERADQERAAAEKRRAEAVAVNTLLQDMLSSADPENVQEADYPVRQLLDTFDQRLAGQIKDQPEVEASIRLTIGRAYFHLGQPDKAETHLARALELRQQLFGAESTEAAECLRELAWIQHYRGDYAGAERTFQDALAMQRRVLAGRPDDLSVARLLNGLGDILRHQKRLNEAEAVLREAADIHRRDSGNETLDAVTNLNNLGLVLYSKGDYAAAESLQRQALPIYRKLLGDRHPVLAIALNNLASMLFDQRRYGEAEEFAREALQIRRQLYGQENTQVAQSENQLGEILMNLRRADEAEPLFRHAAETYRRLRGEEEIDSLRTLVNVGWALWTRGDLAAAESYYRRTLEVRRRVLGDAHPNTRLVSVQLTDLLIQERKFADAESLLREFLAQQRKTLPPESAELARTLVKFGQTLLEQGRGAEAEPPAREALAIQNKASSPEQLERAGTLAVLGWALVEQGKHAEAESFLRDSLVILEKKLPPEHWLRFHVMDLLGGALAAQGRFAEAEPFLRNGYSGLRNAPKRSDAHLESALNRLVQLYEVWDKPEQAAEWRAKREEWRASARPASQPAAGAPATGE